MAKRRSKRRGALSGAAAAAKRAPAQCKTMLSSCMRRPGGRSKARACMVAFNRCRRR